MGCETMFQSSADPICLYVKRGEREKRVGVCVYACACVCVGVFACVHVFVCLAVSAQVNDTAQVR